MSPNFNLWEKSLGHPGLSYFAVNGESILYSAYSESGLLHSLRLLNSGPAVYLGDAKISMSSTRGTRSSEKQKNVQIREGVGSNALRNSWACIFTPRKGADLGEGAGSS